MTASIDNVNSAWATLLVACRTRRSVATLHIVVVYPALFGSLTNHFACVVDCHPSNVSPIDKVRSNSIVQRGHTVATTIHRITLCHVDGSFYSSNHIEHGLNIGMLIGRYNRYGNRGVRKIFKVPYRANVTTPLLSNIGPSRTDMLISRIVGWSIATLQVVINRSTFGSRTLAQRCASLARCHPSQVRSDEIIANIVIKGRNTIAAIAHRIRVGPGKAARSDSSRHIQHH